MGVIKKYKVGMDSECFAISVVEDPAIEETLVALSKDDEKKQIFLESNEKHLIYGAVLVPDLDIYRYDGEREYYVTFTRESIEKMSQDYLKNFRQWEVTSEHEAQVPEVCLVESWIKADMSADKSVALGLNPNLPIGTWFCGMKVNNIDLWDKIKNGSNGFSVESLVSLEEFTKETKEEKMEMNDSFWTKMKNVLSDVLSMSSMREHVELEEVPAVEEVPVVEPTVEEVPVVEPAVEETKVEEPAVEETPVEEPTIEEQVKPNPLEELVKTLQAELEQLKQNNADLNTKIAGLEKLPSAKPINTNVGGGGGGDSYSNWRSQMSRML